MKKLLLASSALVMTAGFAAAEVTLSGDARMGIIDDFGASDVAFTSRARVEFTLSGETDGGLAFGASFRADNAADSAVCVDSDGSGVYESVNADGIDECDFVAGGAERGDAGSVFISGAFGKLSMGDVDGAAQMAVGHVDGVGLTGLSDLNEIVYLGAGGGDTDPTALYEYSTGGFTGYFSATNPGFGDEVIAVGAKYATDTFSVSIGYEDFFGLIDHVVLGATGTFGGVSVKAVYGQADAGGPSVDQYALSVAYTADALTVTAFANHTFADDDRYGLGAEYDLGGGASVVGGFADDGTDSAFDVGVSFDF